ncbi:class I SAM-dependent methyltransferase [Aliikangiella sp. IMCC44653]
MCPSPIPEACRIRQPLNLKAQLNGQDFTFETSFGVFSPKEIDEGTKLLLKYLDIKEDFDCLDLGCGYGPIGLYMAKQAPKGKTILLDKDFVAIQHTKNNIKINQLNNAEARLSNGLSELNEEKFDLIVSNIPAKVGNDMLYLFLYDAFYHLKPGGKFVVVTVNGLRHFCKRVFNEVFGNYSKDKQGKAYTVSSAVKLS